MSREFEQNWLDDPGRLVQYRFYENNPHVVESCLGWDEWKTITTAGKLEEIRLYMCQGMKYQIRVLEQTRIEGLQLIYACMAPNKAGREVHEEQIVPGLDAIRQYLVKHGIISGSSNELGFTIVSGEVAGRFWAKCSIVKVRDEYIMQLGMPFHALQKHIKLYTTHTWREHLSTALGLPPSVQPDLSNGLSTETV